MSGLSIDIPVDGGKIPTPKPNAQSAMTEQADIETQPEVPKNKALVFLKKHKSNIGRVVAVIAVCVLFYFLYTYKIKNGKEDFVVQQPRTDTQAVEDPKFTFDMDIEVKNLIKLQEKYLAQLNK